MENVLILGAGQVGTFAARALERAGARVFAADSDPSIGYFSRYGPKAATELLTADILDHNAVSKLIEKYHVNAIVLTAGLSGEACEQDPSRAWSINVHGPRIVAHAALDSGVNRFVFLSSFSVYGTPAVNRILESTPIAPQSTYGRTKAAAEQILTGFVDKGLNLRILRPCGTYGPIRFGLGSRSARFIEAALVSAFYRSRVTIRASCNSSDEYIYVPDLGRAIACAAIMGKASPEFIFNVGVGRKTTAADLVWAIKQVVPEAGVTIETCDTANHVSERAPLDVERIRNVFGFEPRYDLVEGLTEYARESNFANNSTEGVTVAG